jgi:hypothetical protein
VGSPNTVIEKVRSLFHDLGGFNTLLMITHDFTPFERWTRCMELFAHEVMPNLRDLKAPAPTEPVAAD